MIIGADIERRAGAALTAHWPGAAVRELVPLVGHSGLTFRADVANVPGVDRVALKLCPPGRPPLGRHDVARQGALIGVLGRSGAVPVPDVLGIDATPPPALILSWVEGSVTEPILDPWPPSVTPMLVAARALAAARTLANLHAVDTTSLPETDSIAILSPAEELERWASTMATVDPELRADADRLYATLAATAPEPITPTLVHGDYRLGNLVYDGARVAAIIDWEIWSLGDPRFDLAWLCIWCSPEDLPDVTTAAQVPGADEIRSTYQTQSSHSMAATAWFDAAARYKLAAIMGNNLRRHREGRRVDPYQERLVPVIPALLRRGLALAAEHAGAAQQLRS